MSKQPRFDKSAFFEIFKKRFPTRQMGDDIRGDKMALVVDDSVSVETINKVLEDNLENTGGQYLWLADTHDSLQDYDGTTHEGTMTPVDPNWRSSFIGGENLAADAIEFIREAPKPPKPLCKSFCALLTKEVYAKDSYLLICKAIDGQSEPQTIPIEASQAGSFFVTFRREDWDEAHKDQKLLEI